MKLKIRITNIYDDGEEVIEEKIVDVDHPEDRDLDDWAYDTLYPHTGTGRFAGNGDEERTPDAGYFVEILECEDIRWLVSHEFEFGT